MSLKPGASVGRYRLLSHLGKGGMGDVYLALDTQLERKLALKFLTDEAVVDEQRRRRFLREARAASALNHPNICTVYEVGETKDGSPFIAMEHIEGTTLQARLAAQPMEAAEVVRVGLQVAEALAAAHAEGIIHRDIKPSNIIIDKRGWVKVLDFGLAKRLRQATGARAEASTLLQTQDGRVMGTPSYMSPEQALGKEVDHRSDIFSLGIVLFQAASGVLPFAGETFGDVLEKLIQSEPPPLGQFNARVSPMFEQVVRRCLAKDPSARYDSVAELIEGLGSLPGSEGEGDESRIPETGAETRGQETPSRSGNVNRDERLSRLQTGERRHLTMLACRLEIRACSGGAVDPEDLHLVWSEFQARYATVIGDAGGHITLQSTEEFLACFGYPVAHEDDAQRAVEAGLKLLEVGASGALSPARDCRFSLGLGAHSGIAVIVKNAAQAPSAEIVVQGQPPTTALHLARRARPGQALASSHVHELVRARFEWESAGTYSIEGWTDSVTAYPVIRVSRKRSDTWVGAQLSPLVGRELEVSHLLDKWAQAKRGAGQVVLLRAEPGMGKSRLLHTLREQVLQEDPQAWMECRCNAQSQHSPFHAIVSYFERSLFANDVALSPQDRSARLREYAEGLDVPLEDVLPTVEPLLCGTPPERALQEKLEPEQWREQVLRALKSLLLSRPEARPFVVAVEDLHWADPSTMELLKRIVAEAPMLSLLVVLTGRLEFWWPWPTQEQMTQLNLSRVVPANAQRIIGHLAGGKALPEPILEQIHNRADGIPLFLEELTKMILESGRLSEKATRYELNDPAASLEIPATLHDSLMARLDRFTRARQIVQMASVIGREFTTDLVQALRPDPALELGSELAQLLEAGLLLRRGEGARARYMFKHTLIRDAAYASLLKTERRALHQRIGDHLSKTNGPTEASRPEIIAYHYTECGRLDDAVRYWRLAGKEALEEGATRESVDYLRRGLDLLGETLQESEHAAREFDLLALLGSALVATEGMTSTAAEAAFRRARELGQNLDCPSELFTVIWGLWHIHVMRLELRTAYEFVDELLALAEKGRTAFRVQAHHAGWTTCFHLGKIKEALDHTKAGCRLYDLDEHRSDRYLFGSHDPGVCAWMVRGVLESLLGYPDQGAAHIEKAIVLAQEIGHPLSHALTLAYGGGWLADAHREPQEVLSRMRKLEEISNTYNIHHLRPVASVLEGWAQALTGGEPDTLEKIRSGLKILREAKAVDAPFCLCLLAQVLLKQGDAHEALGVMDEALSLQTESGGIRWLLPELHTLRGEALLQQTEPDRTAARQAFEQAIRIAKEEEGKLLELRATLPLARLMRQQGQQQESKRLLAEVYREFKEGHGISLLKEARELLDELA